jgi:hypothetical protein
MLLARPIARRSTYGAFPPTSERLAQAPQVSSLSTEIVEPSSQPHEQQLGGPRGKAGPVKHPDLALMRVDPGAHARGLVGHEIRLHSEDRSPVRSPKLLMTVASPNSPTEGSPIRLKATAPTQPSLRGSGVNGGRGRSRRRTRRSAAPLEASATAAKARAS